MGLPEDCGDATYSRILSTRNIARARELLGMPIPEADDTHTADDTEPPALAQPCPCCGGPMIIIETFEPRCTPWSHRPRAPPPRKGDSP